MRRKGVALLVVVTVLAALAALVLPFSVAMSQHMRAMRVHSAETAARLAAEGALAHAAAVLHRTQDSTEEESLNARARGKGAAYGPPWNTPEYDSVEELEVSPKRTLGRGVLGALKERGVSFSDSRGTIWSARVEDEQGKINVLSAPPELLGILAGATVLTERLDASGTTLELEDASGFFSDDDPSTVDGRLRVGGEEMRYLSAEGSTISVRRDAEDASRHGAGSVVYPMEAYDVASRAMKVEEGTESSLHTLQALKEFLRPEQFDAVERYVTVWSYRDTASGWIRGEEVKDDFFDSDATRVLVEDASNYGRGAVARLSLNGEVQNVLRVMKPAIRAGRYDIISFEEEVGFVMTTGDEVSVELLQRHPVNVNTAPRSVLVAVFQGLSMKRDYVDGEEAEALADCILSLDEPVKGEADLRELVEAARQQGIISRADAKAVIENALVQTSHNLRYSTTTFCYKAYGSFTVEATGVVNTPAGVPLASHTLRQVISIPPSASGRYSLVTQKDFDVAMRMGPGSKKVATWPNPLSDSEHYEPDDTVADPDEFGDVRMESAEMAAPYGSKGKIEHFEKKTHGFQINPDGLDLTKGGSITLDAKAGFASGGRNVKPGAFAMWFRPDITGGRQCLFDIGRDESQNRVTLHYDSGEDEFVLRVCGPEKVPSGTVAPEFHLPWDIEAGTWYHVAACWKGTLPWQASVRVDGRARSGEDPYYLPGSRLAADINEETDLIAVTDASYYPQKGVVRIGDEIVEYESRSASSLDECERGQRYSYKSRHKKGETVFPYGYSNDLHHDLHKGGSTLAEGLPVSASTTIKLPPGETDIDRGETEIPVESTANFQSSGFIRIAHDVLYYGKLGTSPDGDPCFEDCTLVPEWTQPGSDNKYETDNVSQVSIRITPAQADAYIQGGEDAFACIQSDAGPVEWIHIGEIREEDDKFYIVAPFAYWENKLRYDNKYTKWPDRDDWRGLWGTGRRYFDANTRVVPVVRAEWPRCGNYDPSDAQDRTQDEVTVVASSDSDQAGIRRAYARTRWARDVKAGGGPSWQHDYLVCLDRSLNRKYETGKGARFLKFPSGELPTSLPGKVTVGSAEDGADPVFSVIDEVGFGTGRKCAAIVAPQNAVKVGDGTITASSDVFSCFDTSAPNFPSNGALLLGGELLHSESKSTTTLKIPWYHASDKDQWLTDYSNAPSGPEKSLSCLELDGCTRGILGTSNSAHGTGTAVVALDDYPLTTLDAGGGMGDDEVRVRNAANFPDEGYLFFPQTGEVMGWTLKRQNVLRGCEYLRGCFGTAPVTHSSGELALAIPFRYWSRFVPCTSSSAWCYYQFSCTRPGAVWRSIEWEEGDYTGEGGPEGARPVFFVQFDGYPGWDEEPANRPGSIWMFSRGGEHSFGGVGADEMRVRVGFSHFANAFKTDGTSELWKTTPMVKNVTVRYLMVPVVRERDELDSP